MQTIHNGWTLERQFTEKRITYRITGAYRGEKWITEFIIKPSYVQRQFIFGKAKTYLTSDEYREIRNGILPLRLTEIMGRRIEKGFSHTPTLYNHMV